MGHRNYQSHPSKPLTFNLKFCVKTSLIQVAQHQDPLRGDCEAIVGPCPFFQAGCPNIKVCVVKSFSVAVFIN